MELDPKLAQLAEMCLSHLVREESMLQQARTGLIELHDALTKGDLAKLQETNQRGLELAKMTEELREERRRICGLLAEPLDLDAETINLSSISARLPGQYSARIAAYRDRLQVLVGEVERLTKKTVTIVNYCRNYMKRIMADSFDHVPTIQQYGPGARRDAVRGSLLVAKG